MTIERFGSSGSELLTAIEDSRTIIDSGAYVFDERIAATPNIDGVIILGSSVVGKTTLLHALNDYAVDRLEPDCVPLTFPRRLITRPPRLADSDFENRHVNGDEFECLLANGSADVRWQRRIGDRPVEQYGFMKRDERSLPVYSANNAILLSDEESARRLVDCSLVMQLTAPADVRKARIESRSPDMDRHELESRLADDGTLTIQDERVHMLVPFDNTVTEVAITAVTLMLRPLQRELYRQLAA